MILVRERRTDARALNADRGGSGTVPWHLVGAWTTDVTTVDANAVCSGPAVPSAFAQQVLGLKCPRDWHPEGGQPISAGACKAAIAFVEDVLARRDTLPLPLASPDLRGQVALTWRLDDRSFTVLFPSDRSHKMGYHSEGPGFRYEKGTGSREDIIQRVLALP